MLFVCLFYLCSKVLLTAGIVVYGAENLVFHEVSRVALIGAGREK